MKNRLSPSTAAGKLTNRRSSHALLRSRTLAPLLVLVAISLLFAAPAMAQSPIGANFGLPLSANVV